VRLTYFRVLMPPSKPPGPSSSSALTALRWRAFSGRPAWAAQNLAFSSETSTAAPAASQATRTCRTNHTIQGVTSSPPCCARPSSL